MSKKANENLSRRIIQTLEKISAELQKEDIRMSLEIREGGRQAQAGAEKVIAAVHRIHNVLDRISHELEAVAGQLKDMQRS